MAVIEVLYPPQEPHDDKLTVTNLGECEGWEGPGAYLLPLVKAGRLKALAMMAPQRLPTASTIPTLAEAGLDMGSGTWLGLLAPAKTPKPIIDRLHDETAKVLVDPAMRETLKKLGADPMEMTPARFDAFVRTEIGVNAALVKAAGIQPN